MEATRITSGIESTHRPILKTGTPAITIAQPKKRALIHFEASELRLRGIIFMSSWVVLF